MYHIAVFGLGWWGPKILRNLKQHPLVSEIIGVDQDQGQCEKIATEYGIPTTDDHVSVLNNPNIHAIVIATPPATHFKLARAAFQSGKEVLVTKPPTLTIEELEILVEMANVEDRMFMMDTTFVYNEPIRKLKELLGGGIMDEIRFVQSLRYGNDVRFHHISRLRNTMLKNGINVVDDLLFHDLAILIYLFPNASFSPKAVHCANMLSKNYCDTAFIRVETSDFPIHIGLSWPLPERRREILIADDKKQLIFDDLKQDSKLTLFKIEEQIEESIDHGKTEPLFLVADHFISCIKNRHQALTNGLFMLKVMKLFDSIKSIV